MKCDKCGRKQPSEAEFCYKCGTPLKKTEEKAADTFFLNLSWSWQPMVMASTNDESLSNMIYEQWRQKARLPARVETKQKDGIIYIWYAGQKLGDHFKMKKQDLLNMYDTIKVYAQENGWTLTKPEESTLAGHNDFMSLDASLIKTNR